MTTMTTNKQTNNTYSKATATATVNRALIPVAFPRSKEESSDPAKCMRVCVCVVINKYKALLLFIFHVLCFNYYISDHIFFWYFSHSI